VHAAAEGALQSADQPGAFAQRLQHDLGTFALQVSEVFVGALVQHAKAEQIAPEAQADLQIADDELGNERFPIVGRGVEARHRSPCRRFMTERASVSAPRRRATSLGHFAGQWPSRWPHAGETLRASELPTWLEIAVFVNVPGGAATVSGTHVGSGELVRTATLFARPGWGSSLVLGPYASPAGG